MYARIVYNILLISLLPVCVANALPEYALRYNQNRCTSCHYSPVGGGPRNLNGKQFGAHGFKINPLLVQDYFSADFRALFYYPQRPTGSKGGMGVMSGSIAGHAALDEAKNVQMVMDANLAGFSANNAALRDTYALIRLAPDDGQNHWLDSLIIGRFRAPFGIISDEHRTYVRIQTATEWFNFETGLMLSGTPKLSLHYDLALVNGEKSSGQSLSTEQATKWGGVANVRWMPGAVALGLSHHYLKLSTTSASKQAWAVYGLLSVARMTEDRLPLTLRLEYDQAKNWNSHLAAGFAQDPAGYVKAVSSAQSQGWWIGADWALTPRFVMIYKYDLLIPDRDFQSDFYQRHGIGFRWHVAPAAILQLRTEFARATHPSEMGATATGGQNATFALLQLSI